MFENENGSKISAQVFAFGSTSASIIIKLVLHLFKHSIKYNNINNKRAQFLHISN